MKTKFINIFTGVLVSSVLSSFASAAVICGETVDSSTIQIRDNYLDGREWKNKAFMDAIIFEGTDLRTTLCDVGETRFLIIKKANQSSGDSASAIILAYPVPRSCSQSSWR